jgi:predicted transcriptional regulator
MVYMKSVLVQLDDETLKELDRIAPPEKRARAEFIRRAIKDALHRSEFDRIREAYLKQPDESLSGDLWPNPEEWRPE